MTDIPTGDPESGRHIPGSGKGESKGYVKHASNTTKIAIVVGVIAGGVALAYVLSRVMGG